jgi:hypothetical protein
LARFLKFSVPSHNLSFIKTVYKFTIKWELCENSDREYFDYHFCSSRYARNLDQSKRVK